MNRIDEPRNDRSKRTRTAILDAVWHLLEEGPPDRVTMSAVAARAGITRRALYLHFASRGEMLLAVHAHIDEGLDLEASLRPVLDASDAVTMLREFAAHLSRYHPRVRRIDAALWHARGTDPDLDALIDGGTERWHVSARAICQRLADDGRLAPPWTVETAADLLWSYMFPGPLELFTVARGWSEEQYGELLAVLFERTLVRPAA